MVYPIKWCDVFCNRLKKLTAYPFVKKMVTEGEATLWVGMGYGKVPPLYVTFITEFEKIREFVFAAVVGKNALNELSFFINLAGVEQCNYMVLHSRSRSRTKLFEKIGFKKDEVLMTRGLI